MEEVLQLQISGKFNGRDANISINFEAESAFEIEDVEAGDVEMSDSSESEVEESEVDTEVSTPEEPETPTSPEEVGQAEAEPKSEEVSSASPATGPELEADEVEEEPESEEDAAGMGTMQDSSLRGQPDAQTMLSAEDTDVPVDVTESSADTASEYDTDVPVQPSVSSDDDGSEDAEEGEDEEELPPFSANTKQFSVASTVLKLDDEWSRVRDITDRLKQDDGEGEWNDSKTTSHLYSVMDKEIVDRKKDQSTGKYVYTVTDLGERVIEKALKDAGEWEGNLQSSV